jgi:hypothetical protein
MCTGPLTFQLIFIDHLWRTVRTGDEIAGQVKEVFERHMSLSKGAVG